MERGLPPFPKDGLLPPGEYTLTVDELRTSMLVLGAGERDATASRRESYELEAVHDSQ